MTNKMLYLFLIVGALVSIPDTVLADTGSTEALNQAPIGTYNNSSNTTYRQPIGASRLVTTKSTYAPQASSTANTSAKNTSAFRRPGAFQYRKGYQRKKPCRRVKKRGPGLPGHNPAPGVPELDASVSQSAFVLLIGTVLVVRGRRRRYTQSK